MHRLAEDQTGPKQGLSCGDKRGMSLGVGLGCSWSPPAGPCTWSQPLLKGPFCEARVRQEPPPPGCLARCWRLSAGGHNPDVALIKQSFSFVRMQPPVVKGPIYRALGPLLATPPALWWRWLRPPVIYSFNLAHSRWARAA